jgi:ribosomal protein S15P/S13E
LVISDDAVDFNNYTVWSSPIIGVYRNLADAALRFPIKQTSRATAVSTGAYLEEFVGKDGKIYMPVFEPRLGLRFDFEIRLYDYVAPVPVIEVDVEALTQELKRLEDELKAETENNANDLKIAQLRSQIEAIREVLQAEEEKKKLLEEEAAAALAKLEERA